MASDRYSLGLEFFPRSVLWRTGFWSRNDGVVLTVAVIRSIVDDGWEVRSGSRGNSIGGLYDGNPGHVDRRSAQARMATSAELRGRVSRL